MYNFYNYIIFLFALSYFALWQWQNLFADHINWECNQNSKGQNELTKASFLRKVLRESDN